LEAFAGKQLDCQNKRTQGQSGICTLPQAPLFLAVSSYLNRVLIDAIGRRYVRGTDLNCLSSRRQLWRLPEIPDLPDCLSVGETRTPDEIISSEPFISSEPSILDVLKDVKLG
jgi:hypothetical protein